MSILIYYLPHIVVAVGLASLIPFLPRFTRKRF